LRIAANATQSRLVASDLRDFYDIDLGFVGNTTKPYSACFLTHKNTVSPLKRGLFLIRQIRDKKHGTQHAIGGMRGQQSGRIVTLLRRLTGTSG
jgi:hypothetical protein